MRERDATGLVGNRWGLPDLGTGLGFRGVHASRILEERPPVGFFELISENVLDPTRRLSEIAEELADLYPVVLHGVSLSIGSYEPPDRRYLAKLKRLAQRLRPVWVSDHLCFTRSAGRSTHDLLPLPYDDSTLRFLVERVRAVGEILERPLVLENPSTYLEHEASTMSEAVFLTRLAQESGCGLLVDVNNVYVTCRNHGLDARAYLAELPAERIVQVHLAGHRDKGTHLLDTHDAPIAPAVWELYDEFSRRFGPRSTSIEWDDGIPPLEVLLGEVDRAERRRRSIEATTAPVLERFNG